MSNLVTQRETITVLKPKNERFNDINENKINRQPKFTLGYYILNLNDIQKNDPVEENAVVTLPDHNLGNKNNKSNLNSNSEQINGVNISESEESFDVFDSLAEIDDIIETSEEYHSLTKVELPKQQLTSVPNDIWNLNEKFNKTEDKYIKVLNCTYLNHNISDINRYPVRVLDLSCNYLKQVSGEIKNLSTLQVLNVSNNQLVSLPNELAELHELEEINLSFNLFQDLPKILYKLPNLKILFIKFNYISAIEKDFKYFNQLQIFDISENSLCSWPYPILTVKTIIELNLDSNKIPMVPDQIHSMKNLKYLRLKCNHIRRLPKMHKMNALELIDVSNNSIQNFPDFYGSIYLREIYLDNNQIQKMDCNCLIGTVTNFLSVSSNKLNEIIGYLSLIDTIKFLDISNNELESLPNDFYRLDYIKAIKLNNNPFTDPNIINYNELGTKNLIEYFMEIYNEKLEIPEGPRYILFDRYDHTGILKSDDFQRCVKLTTDSEGHLPNWMFRRAEYDEILRLDLSKSKHKQLPSQLLQTSQYLEELYVTDNLLIKLPNFIEHFTKLRILDLRGNSLFDLPEEIVYCVELYYLNISFNQFVELPSVILSMEKLKILLANDNQIKEINLEFLRKIKKINISKNCIQKFVFI